MPDVNESIGWLERLAVTFGASGSIALFMLLVVISAFVMRHREHRRDTQEQFKTMARQAKDTDKALDGIKAELGDLKGMVRRALRRGPT